MLTPINRGYSPATTQFSGLRPPRQASTPWPYSEVLELRRDRFLISDKLAMLVDAALGFKLPEEFVESSKANPARAIRSLFVQAYSCDSGTTSPMTITAELYPAHRTFLTASIPAYRQAFSPEQARRFAERLKPGVILLSKSSIVDPQRETMLAHEERHRALALLCRRWKKMRVSFSEAFTEILQAIERKSVPPSQLEYFPKKDRACKWGALLRKGLGSGFEPEEFFNRCFDLSFKSYLAEFAELQRNGEGFGFLPALACRLALGQALTDPAVRRNPALQTTLRVFSTIAARAKTAAERDMRALRIVAPHPPFE